MKAVIFDFDGVLADSERLHFRAFAAVLAREGIALTVEENNSRFLGIDDRGCFQLALGDSGLNEPSEAKVESLVAEKCRLYRQALQEIELFSGARKLVEEAAARGPSTIASCATRQDVEAVLDRHGLSVYFPRFITADEISRSKPDPECFLKALDLLRSPGNVDLQPEECLVFEDSFRGIEAAKRAGMQCVAVTHSYPAERLAAADRVIDSLSEWRWPAS